VSRDVTVVGLLDVVKDPAQIANVDAGEIPALLAQLSAVQSSIAARLVATSKETKPSDDVLLDVEEAASRLDVSQDWLYRRTQKLPFVVRVGRHVRFSSNGIERFIKNKMGR